MTLIKDSGWILGKITAGTPTFIQNAGFVWAAIPVPLVIAAWFGMNNLLPLSPNYGGTLAAFAKIVYLWCLTCLVGGLGLYLYLPAPTGLGLLNMWVALPSIIVAALLVDHAAGCFWRDEGQHRQAVRHLQEQAHLVPDAAVHRDLRLVHRLLDGACRCRSP